ncbi:hypothetical protein LOM8899_00873 [Flavimaricola marinus]|uniref:Uncharacterized protein n=1 Tax=Flavimaricola marinus TaxID=1819565 RepID=A0A238LB16_9RHOB|nr:hypothetical protein LOM8899_00873 [Flavimaricola marinus]
MAILSSFATDQTEAADAAEVRGWTTTQVGLVTAASFRT